LKRFADVFHHRMLCFHYRAWADAQPAVGFDRPEQDDYATYVGGLFGLGQEALRNRDALPDLAKLYHAGHFACQDRPAVGLRDVVADFFQVPVIVREFVGEWLTLPHDGRWRLGTQGTFGILGLTTAIGAQSWSRQHKFRIVVGPIGFEDFERLLPGGASLDRLIAMVRLYCGDAMAWDLRLILRRQEVPPLVLGRSGALSRTAWINTARRRRDADDALISPLRHVRKRAAPAHGRQPGVVAEYA
jgi:type VI secretion system protein ImpH